MSALSVPQCKSRFLDLRFVRKRTNLLRSE
jgi:hypothetical protein